MGRHPQPPAPPVEVLYQVHIGCSDEHGVIHLPSGGSLRLDKDGVVVQGVVFPPTQIHFTLPSGHGYGNGATLKLDGLDEFTIDSGDPGGPDRIVTAPDVNILLHPRKQIIDLPELMTDGIFFKTALGPVGVKEATSFRLFKMFLDGEDIEPIVDELVECGFNFVRVFGMCRNMFDLDPSRYGAAYYQKLTEFIAYLAHKGLYTEFTVFPDVRLIHDDQRWQVMHWEEVCRSLEPVKQWVLVEPQNEVDQTPNVMDLSILNHPSWLITCYGTFGSSYAIPPRPWKRYEAVHLNDQSEWQRKPHNAMEVSQGTQGLPASHVPCICNEITRFPDKDNDTNHFVDAAASAALLCAGICYHYVSGKLSAMMSADEKYCAKLFCASYDSVPLKYRYGNYYRPESVPSGVLRVYGKDLGGDRFEVIVRN